MNKKLVLKVALSLLTIGVIGTTIGFVVVPYIKKRVLAKSSGASNAKTSGEAGLSEAETIQQAHNQMATQGRGANSATQNNLTNLRPSAVATQGRG